MSERGRPGFRNIPPPQGAAAKPASAYTRFIPREEVQNVAAWQPHSFGEAPRSGPAAEPEPSEPPPPTPEEIRAGQQAARQAGYQDGYRDGLVALEGFKESFSRQATQQIGQLVSAFDVQFEAIEARMAEALAQAATAIARQVVRQELRIHPELIAHVAREAVSSLLLSARHVTVQVHPDDLPLVADGAADELERRGARLVASASVARGGCVVESDVGCVDADIEARWQRAAGALGEPGPLGSAPGAHGPLVLRDGDVQ